MTFKPYRPGSYYRISLEGYFITREDALLFANEGEDIIEIFPFKLPSYFTIKKTLGPFEVI